MKTILALFALSALLAVGSAQVSAPDFSAPLKAVSDGTSALINAVKAEVTKLSPASQSQLVQFTSNYYTSIQNTLTVASVNTQNLAKAIAAMKLNEYNQQIINELNG